MPKLPQYFIPKFLFGTVYFFVNVFVNFIGTLVLQDSLQPLYRDFEQATSDKDLFHLCIFTLFSLIVNIIIFLPVWFIHNRVFKKFTLPKKYLWLVVVVTSAGTGFVLMVAIAIASGLFS